MWRRIHYACQAVLILSSCISSAENAGLDVVGNSPLNFIPSSSKISKQNPVHVNVETVEGGIPAEVDSFQVVWQDESGSDIGLPQKLEKISRGEYRLDCIAAENASGKRRAVLSGHWEGQPIQEVLELEISGQSEAASKSTLTLHVAIHSASGASLAEDTVHFPDTVQQELTLTPDTSLEVAVSTGGQLVDSLSALKLICTTSKQAVLLGFRKNAGTLRANGYTLLQNFDRKCNSLEMRLESLDDGKELTWGIGHLHCPQGGIERPLSLQAPKPDIVHQFRRPDKRPHEVVAYAFTFAVAIPILVLASSWSSIGINLQDFPQSFLHQVLAISFHGSLLAIVLLYVAFWGGLNLLQTVPILCILGLFAAISGYKLLSLQYCSRQKKI